MKISQNTAYLFCFITFIFSHHISAQCSENVMITNQTDLNNFDCSSFSGNLVIRDNNDGIDDIIDLQPLSILTNVSGNFIIRECNSLTSLQGISGITTISGDLTIRDNTTIFDTGDSSFNVESIGGNFLFINNDAFIEFSAIESLNVLGESLVINDNDLLESFGMPNLMEIDSLFFNSNNPNLTSLEFDELETIGDMLFISLNGFTDIDGFNSLISVSEITILGCSQLSTISGFQNLTSIASGDLLVGSCPLSGSFNGFSNLQSAHNIMISSCNELTDISPLSNLTTVNGDLVISDCPLLNECCLLIGIEPVVNGLISIENNGSSCSNYDALVATVPQITSSGGTLDCINTSVQLMGSSTSANVSFSWTGPFGFSSSEMNPTVTEPGIYTLTINPATGCSANQSVEVIADTDLSDVQLSLGDANCDEGTRLINTVISMDDIDVIWSGPNGYTSTDLSPSISESGTYTVETFPTNGCNSMHSITMNDDVTFTHEINTIDISDNNSTGQAAIMIMGGTGPFSIFWDNGQTGTSVIDLTEGEHTVEVTDGLGCVRVFEFFINNLVATFETEWKEDVSLYPNPSSDQINMDFSTSSKYFDKISIYNVDGNIVKEISLNRRSESISFSVNEWTSGVYLARIFADQSSYTVRFMVK